MTDITNKMTICHISQNYQLTGKLKLG